jgi:alpha-glucosidase
VDGFRLDAIHELLKDPELRDDPPATEPFPLPLDPTYGELAHVYSANAPDVGDAVAAIREAAGPDAMLIGEIFLPASGRRAYLEHLDAAFAFQLVFASLDPAAIRSAIGDELASGKPAWVLSNHDFSRIATRWGQDAARLAATLMLTLPGPVFVFQGDELGQPDGPGHDPPYDRAGRDPYRHPPAWDESAHAGFTDGRPWLEPVRGPDGPASIQLAGEDSMLAHYRDLIALRRRLGGPLRFLESSPGTLAYARGKHVITLNFDTLRATVHRG